MRSRLCAAATAQFVTAANTWLRLCWRHFACERFYGILNFLQLSPSFRLVGLPRLFAEESQIVESAFEFKIWNSDLQTEILNFKPQRLPEEGFAETEQKRRSPEGKSLLSRIKILRPPSKRRRRRNISREIFLLLLLPHPHPISSNSYSSSIL